MKKLLVILFLSLSSFVVAQKPIELYSVELSVATIMPSPVPTSTDIEIIFCERGDFGFHLGKKRLVITGGATSFDLDKKRKAKKNKSSWIAEDRETELIYLVSPFYLDNDPAIMVQPVGGNYLPLHGKFYVITTNKRVCE